MKNYSTTIETDRCLGQIFNHKNMCYSDLSYKIRMDVLSITSLISDVYISEDKHNGNELWINGNIKYVEIRLGHFNLLVLDVWS